MRRLDWSDTFEKVVLIWNSSDWWRLDLPRHLTPHQKKKRTQISRYVRTVIILTVDIDTDQGEVTQGDTGAAECGTEHGHERWFWSCNTDGLHQCSRRKQDIWPTTTKRGSSQERSRTAYIVCLQLPIENICSNLSFFYFLSSTVPKPP